MNLKSLFVLALGIAVLVGLIVAGPMLIGKSYADEVIPGKTPVSKRISNSYIVTLKDDTPESFIKMEANKVNQTLKKQGGHVDHVYEHALKGFSVKNVNNPSVLLGDPNIATIEPDYMDQTQRQYVPTGIDRIDLDRATTAAYKPNNREDRHNIDVAVLDERVVPGHPDLNLFQSVSFLGGGQEPGTHGTHVAGTVAAKDNLGGVVGVVPGARIWSLAICDTDSNPNTNIGCPTSAALAAFDYVVDNAASIDIATMSVGCSPPSAAGCAMTGTIEDAITAMITAGVTFFVSAGNSGAESNNHRYCGADSAICVSALDDRDGKCGGTAGGTDDRRASFSNWGSEVDIMAPGVAILSTWPYTGEVSAGDNLPYIGVSQQGDYDSISGTSMATPLAAGVGALINVKNPSFTPAQIKSDMLAKAYPQNQACDGFGRGGLVSGANSRSSEEILVANEY